MHHAPPLETQTGDFTHHDFASLSDNACPAGARNRAQMVRAPRP
jgi:hypothetical protein